MFKITYQPADTELIERMLSENGTYMVTVHNRHIVKCERAVALAMPAPPSTAPGAQQPPPTNEKATTHRPRGTNNTQTSSDA